jgi:uncharacterized damage-inducible protein DinB
VNVEDIRSLFAFNHWANRRLLSAARPISPEDFLRDLRSSHGSVRGTLIHIIGGQWVWLRLWQGEPSKQIVARCDALWDPKRFPDVAALEAAHASLEHDQKTFIDGLTDDRVTTRISFESLQGQQCDLSLSEMMQHVLHHSTYHRGQVVTLLRQLGQTPPGTDFVTFLREGTAAQQPVGADGARLS